MTDNLGLSPHFSDYVVFVDESGDHGIETIDPTYPLFVLCFCIFKKQSYTRFVVPAVTELKFRTFGHDHILLHEHDIRKRRGSFSALGPEARELFLNDLTEILASAEFNIVAVVIQKMKLLHKCNPYHIAMQYGLERVSWFLKEKGQETRRTHFLFECRGKKEDEALELEFRRVCDGYNDAGAPLPFIIQMVDKKSNSPGLQVADLTARPVGLMVLRPDQDNRTREVLEEKFYKGSHFGGRVQKLGFGLKIFPQ